MIKWKESFSVGIKQFDNEHKELIRFINKIEKLIKDDLLHADELYDELQIIFDEILDYTVFHFNNEEVVFEEKNYSNIEDHKNEHNIFIENVKDLMADFQLGQDEKKAATKIYDTLVEWLLKHILSTDKKYMTELQ